MQVPTVYSAFLKLFQTVNFSRVVEIGTAQGGFTLILRDALDEAGQKDCLLRTYDTAGYPHGVISSIEAGANIERFQENIFNTKIYPWTLSSDSSDVVNYIKSPGKTLVLCDGGCKRMEFPVLSEVIKPGDHIMAHDYAKSTEVFKEHIENKIWNWCEIKYSDVEPAFNSYGLEYYMEETFADVVWLSAVKK